MREEYDLSHYSFTTGRMGRLMTNTRLLTLPGDSIEIDVLSLLRLSTLRRPLSIDAIRDTIITWIPMRWIYSDWMTVLKEGVDHSTVFTGTTMPTSLFAQLGYPNITLGHLGGDVRHATNYPLHMIYPYNMVWNWYFRNKQFTPEINLDYNSFDVGQPTSHTATNSPITNSINQQIFGYLTPRPKEPWTTGFTHHTGAQVTTADYEYSTGGTTVDIIALEQLQKRLGSELIRDYFSPTYPGIVESIWNVKPTVEAEETPLLLLRNTSSIGGQDVIGTADGNHGDRVGKGEGFNQINMPRKFFEEHGVLQIQTVVRFPSMSSSEINYLDVTPAPTYKEIMGDPNIVSSEKPVDATLGDFFDSGGATAIGKIPYGQWYRYKNNYVHTLYHSVSGYPFLKQGKVTSALKAVYCQDDDYNHVFHSNMLGHWNDHSAIRIKAIRNYPQASTSIFAGAKV